MKTEKTLAYTLIGMILIAILVYSNDLEQFCLEYEKNIAYQESMGYTFTDDQKEPPLVCR